MTQDDTESNDFKEYMCHKLLYRDLHEVKFLDV